MPKEIWMHYQISLLSILRNFPLSISTEMILIFEKDVEQLTGRSTAMGIDQYLLEREKQCGERIGEERSKTRP